MQAQDLPVLVTVAARPRARRAFAIRPPSLTCDLDGRVMPKVSTSFSIRGVLTPNR